MRPITFAHRGGRAHAPENTIEAFTRARTMGPVGLESDARCSADGVAVLAHDPLRRVGLRRLAISSTSAERLRATGVPSLADLYEHLGTDFDLSLDLKTPDAGLAAIGAAREADAPLDRLWLCAPELDLLSTLRSHESNVRLVHSIRRRGFDTPMERHAADLAAARIDAVNFHRSEWTRGLVTLYHRFDVLAFGWNAQEVRQIRVLIAMGIDAVYCDHVDRMLEAVSEGNLVKSEKTQVVEGPDQHEGPPHDR